MTLFSSLALTAALLYFLYQSCSNQYVQCSPDLLPMISDTICLKIYDRVFCILAIFFALGVQQTNVRAFYRVLYGLSSNSSNDRLYFLGMVSVICLPLIGYFDEHQYPVAHYALAIGFFGGTAFYAFMLSTQLNSHKDKFD